MPTTRPAKPVAAAPVEAPPASSTEIVTETPADAGREAPASATRPASAATRAASKPAAAAPTPAVAATKPEPKPEPKPAASAVDAKRAQALLEGKSAEKTAETDPAKKEGRFVVQVGAFAENAAAHDMRLKVEKLGLKTYAQVAETPQGHRIRVRVGPFATRDEAEKAQAKIKASGAQAVVLTL
jgi:DedD protein